MKKSALLWIALTGLAADVGCSASSSSPANGEPADGAAIADGAAVTDGAAVADDASSGPDTSDGATDDGSAVAVRNACAASATRHRSAPVACPATGSPWDGGVDAGPTCTTTADCGDTRMTCLQGRCGLDQCTTDTDCPNGGVCSCMGSTRGYAGASPANVCVPANCRTDADCGDHGACSPTDSTSGPFYGIQGYFCHTCTDACTNDVDCTDAGVSCFGGPYCAFDPTVGSWTCGTSCAAG